MSKRDPATAWHWTDRRIHQSTQDTRQRAYDKLRKDGVTKDNARRIAEDTARQAHERLDKK